MKQIITALLLALALTSCDDSESQPPPKELRRSTGSTTIQTGPDQSITIDTAGMDSISKVIYKQQYQ